MAPEPPPHSPAGSTGLSIESVAFATGTGRLVRRASAVLFDPTGHNTKLTSAFDDANDDRDAVDQAIAALIDAGLEHEPFAIVRWGTSIELIVFGDVAVETSVPSAPLVSGASSTTWVTHVIDADRLDTSPLQISCGQPAEPGTNLRLGIAACDGFRLDLSSVPADLTPADTAAPEPASPTAPAGKTLEVPAAEPPPVEAPNAAAVVTPTPAPPPTPEPPNTAALVTPTPAPPNSERATIDPLHQASPEPMPPGVDAIWTSDEPDGPGDEPANDGAASPALASDEEAGQSIDASSHDDGGDPFVIEDPTPKLAAPPGGPLLEFDTDAPAADHHADAALPAAEAPGPTPETAVPAPESATADDRSEEGIEWTDAVFGKLVFDRFPDSPIDGPAVLGRKPEATGDQTAIVIDHPEVSRNHAELQVDGWSVTLIDLESRNGTWVQPPTGEGVRRLDPDERVVLMPGTIVHLGSADVAFTWHQT